MANAVVNNKAKDNYATFRAAITLVQQVMDDQVPGVIDKVSDADMPSDAWSVPTADELKSLAGNVVREIEVLTEDAKKYEVELISRGWRV
ncbi:hypothetical protein SAMN04488564_118158 [Lentzea waywayandensis]|uniref:Uncharacterized protein n=1 Tax=Lentzea waywayandensis TaxID=84724 RepID=A0A1I6FHT1_9PSEU|nr:hypothetical protein [Lentzea waywayandensis]SFR29357.1 hypothetical protein SAMN04488564_118158 [Lentzea waywayandensis]